MGANTTLWSSQPGRRSPWGLDRFSRRLRPLVPLLSVAIGVGLLASPPAPASAGAAVLPPGATAAPPVQKMAAAPKSSSVPVEATQGKAGPGAAAPTPSGHAVPPFMTRPQDPASTPRQTRLDADRRSAGAGARQRGIPVEVETARTARTTEVANPDGTYSVRVYDDVSFVPDSSGVLRPLNSALARSEKGRLVPTAAARVSLASWADDADLARWDVGGRSVGFGLAGAPAVAATVDGGVARYSGVARDTDLELSATADGVKEVIVLRSAAAPRSWTFPLRAPGLTPVLQDSTGAVLFTDGQGAVVAMIPPGFMEDSAVDPASGASGFSRGVRYSLEQRDGGWVLRVDLDAAWLAAKARVWPVRVDPSLATYWTEDDDTFVSSSDYPSQNNSGRGDLLVGTYNGGTEKSASYLHLSGAVAALAGKTIVSANVKAYNYWSYSCTAKPLSLYKVTAAWTGASATTYPGPAFEATALSTSTFAYGYSSCPATNWGSLSIPAARMQAWVNGTEPFYGLTLRASATDSTGWKRFRSSNYPTVGQRPFLEVTYTYTAPGVSAVAPMPNTTVDSLTPTFWADLVDPAATGTKAYTFKVCNGTPAAPEGCVDSGPEWLTSPTWPVPAGTLAWSKESWWQVNVGNGITESGWLGPWYFTPVLAQPPVTSHLAGAEEGAQMPGVNPQVGNYSTAVTDASVAVVGPPLQVARTYNSQDLRTSGAFGTGWSTPWDQRVDLDDDGSGNVVVTLATGRQVRFGQNPDGTYSPPMGQNVTLVYEQSLTGWAMRDGTGLRRVFDDVGRPVSVSDVDGRTQTFTYTGNQLTTVTDVSSGRSLHVAWSGNHIASVAADPPAPAQPAPTWTYTYSGDTLTTVCTALGATSCTTYAYTASSHYRSTVLDDDPAAYWPLGESSGTVAANAAARTSGEYDGTYSGVTLGVTGALTGSPDTATAFAGATPSKVTVPADLASRSVTLGIELWFKAASGASGVLYSEQSTVPPAVPSVDWTPNLYIGTDGKLRGQYWTPVGGATPITTGGTVTNGQWHHAVLSGSVDHQELYLDATLVGSITGRTIAHSGMRYPTIGNGYTNLWPAAAAGNLPFTGQVDDVAVYRHALTAGQVTAHYAARVATSRMSTVVEPGTVTPVVSLTYQHATGRVITLADRHSATWTLSAPVLTATQRQVTVTSNARTGIPITYSYDPGRDGRLVSRTDAFGTRAWGYSDTTGFVSSIADENGNATRYDTDTRGNVTTKTTIRSGVDYHEYFGYYLDPEDPLDPRNDVQIWSADARSADANDLTYRTTRTLNANGRVTSVSYPKPAGQATNPTETFSYSSPYTIAKTTGSFLPASTVLDMDGDDDAVSWVPLPFSMPYFGETRDNIWISNDGYLTFSELNDWPWPFEQSAPDPALPNNVVMPFMDDFIIDGDSSTVRTATSGIAPNRQFVVEWRDAEAWANGSPDGTPTFEVILSENGTIQFRYSGTNPASPREKGSRATIGLENETGTTAVMYSHNEPSIIDGDIITFTPTGSAIPAGLPLMNTASNGGVTTNTYNSAGDILTTVNPVGLVATNTYDALGRRTTQTTSGTVGASPVSYGTTSYTYNPLSQPLTVTSPAIYNSVTSVWHTPVTTYAYDTGGRRTSEARSDSTGGDATRTTSWAYDPAGRLISTTAPDGTVTSQTWSTAGNVATTTAPGGPVVVYAYDDEHRLFTKTATGAGVDPITPAATTLLLETRTYDPAGRLASVTDAMGRTTSYTYYTDNLIDTTSQARPLAALPALVTEKRTYDPAGHPTAVVTADGTITTNYTYDPAGNTATQTLDPAGLNRVTAISYNPDASVHHRTASVGGAGRTERVDYTYDALGRSLTTVTDNTGGTPAALTTTLVRDPRGLVTRETDPTGVVTDHTYDLAGQLVATTGAARTIWVAGVQTTGVAPITTLGRNTFGDLTQQRDANGQTTTTGYDPMGRPTSTTRPSYTPPGGSAITAATAMTYNNLGQPATTTDALGNVTTLSYDAYGRLLSSTQPDPDGAGPKTSPVWLYAYNRAGQISRTTDPTGGQMTATFDDLGLQATRTVSELVSGVMTYYTTAIGYDNDANPTTATTASHTTTVAYNKAGEVTRTTDPTNRFTENTYDLAGRILSTVSGQGSGYASPVTETSYDLAGRPTSSRDCTASASGTCTAVLRTRTATFDAAGRATQTTTAQGRPTSFGYDTAGQLTSVTQRVTPANPATAITVNLGYDRLGNTTRMVDGNANATTYTYNTWNLPESTIEPSTTAHPNATDRTWTTVYNAAGRVTADRLPGSVTRTKTYDNLGRLTAETATGATTSARALDYDPAGRLISATSPAGNLSYTYTERGLLKSANGYGGAAAYSYDAEANLTQRVDGTGTAIFGYDAAGRLTTTQDPLTATTATNTYTPAGKLFTVSHGAGNATRGYTYDNLGRVDTDTTLRPAGTTSASVDYDYDLDDLLTSKTTTGFAGAGASTYTYDGLSRITSWLSPAGTTTGYGYDAASNRTTVTTAAGTRTSTYDQRNRITATSGASLPADAYAWNPRGSLVTATKNSQTTTYTFDAFERLTQVQKTAGYTAAFTYDSLDRPAQRNAANFAYDDLTNNPVLAPVAAGETKLLRDPTGTAIATKTGAAAGALLLDDPLHTDLGATTDPATGNLITSTSYDPWGAPTAATGTQPPIGYQGGYTDPDSGLVNAHARWYDPTLAAFTSRDTWTLPPVPVAQPNRYLYAGASPLIGRDPTGHQYQNEGGASAPSSPPANPSKPNKPNTPPKSPKPPTSPGPTKPPHQEPKPDLVPLIIDVCSANPSVCFDLADLLMPPVHLMDLNPADSPLPAQPKPTAPERCEQTACPQSTTITCQDTNVQLSGTINGSESCPKVDTNPTYKSLPIPVGCEQIDSPECDRYENARQGLILWMGLSCGTGLFADNTLACELMQHYADASGTDFTVDVDKLLLATEFALSVEKTLDALVAKAKAACALPPCDLTFDTGWKSLNFNPDLSESLYYAFRGMNYQLVGTVHVGDGFAFVNYTATAYKAWNFDRNESLRGVPFKGAADAAGYGMAQEFAVVGTSGQHSAYY